MPGKNFALVLYTTYVRKFLVKHEAVIDANLAELKERGTEFAMEKAGDIAKGWWSRFVCLFLPPPSLPCSFFFPLSSFFISPFLHTVHSVFPAPHFFFSRFDRGSLSLFPGSPRFLCFFLGLILILFLFKIQVSARLPQWACRRPPSLWPRRASARRRRPQMPPSRRLREAARTPTTRRRNKGLYLLACTYVHMSFLCMCVLMPTQEAFLSFARVFPIKGLFLSPARACSSPLSTSVTFFVHLDIFQVHRPTRPN
jgi:hypothetical protein